MVQITSSDIDDDHWATDAMVRDYIDIPTKGNAPELEPFITSATDTVQSWWKKATDGDVPDDLPPTDDSNPNQLENDHPLLVRATALLAASEAHEAKAQQIRSEGDEGDRKHVFLSKRARSKFEDWVTVNGYGETDVVQSQQDEPVGQGKSRSLIDLGG